MRARVDVIARVEVEVEARAGLLAGGQRSCGVRVARGWRRGAEGLFASG